MATYWWGLDNGNSLDNLLAVHLGSGTLEVSHDRGHAGLVAHRGSEVDGLLGVIFGEASLSQPVSSNHIII